MDEVVRIVKGLQLFDATHLMAPANWPHNEIIGDNVLVPPSIKLTAAEIAPSIVAEPLVWSLTNGTRLTSLGSSARHEPRAPPHR